MQQDIWSIVTFASLAGWIVSALFLAFAAFPAKGQFMAPLALKWGAALAISYALWIVGMLHV